MLLEVDAGVRIREMSSGAARPGSVCANWASGGRWGMGGGRCVFVRAGSGEGAGRWAGRRVFARAVRAPRFGGVPATVGAYGAAPFAGPLGYGGLAHAYGAAPFAGHVGYGGLGHAAGALHSERCCELGRSGIVCFPNSRSRLMFGTPVAIRT